MAKPRGRPAKPTALKVIEGTDRPDRVNDDEPIPHGPLGDPPKGLSKEAKSIWKEFAPVYWWATDADRPTFERFCEVFALWRMTLGAIHERENGPVQIAESGYETTSGAMQALDKLSRELDGIASSIGQTPVARTKIKTGKRPAESPWGQFKRKA